MTPMLLYSETINCVVKPKMTWILFQTIRKVKTVLGNVQHVRIKETGRISAIAK